MNKYRQYAPTAYADPCTKTLPRTEIKKLDFTTKNLRKNPLPRYLKAQCSEFLSVDDINIIGLLISTKREVHEEIDSPGHELQTWETLRNPKVAIETATGVLGFFSAICWVGVICFSILFLFKKPQVFITLSFLNLLIVPFIVLCGYLLGKLLLKLNIFCNKYNIELNRRKGTIRCPSKKNPDLEIPFEEFDPYLNHSANASGRICYHLTLHHRYSDEWVSYPEEMEDEWQVNQAWEFWQQYMDVSRPLPDTPRMEPYRSRDPVTAKYDRRHNRPADYWKNMDIAQADRMQDAAMAAATEYPWGATREQALAQGWRPSGFGEGDWQRDGAPGIAD